MHGGWGLVAFFLSAMSIAPSRRIAIRVGAVALPRSDRWRREPVPLLGGAAIYAAFAATTLLAVPMADPRVALLLGVGSGVFLLGVWDDMRALGPRAKLAAEVVAAIVLVAFGLQLRATEYPLVNAVVTVLWVVGMVNAINLLDNMDGLAAGVTVIAGCFQLAVFFMDGDGTAALMSAILIGATAGFLMFNWRPASIFMGDAGSLFLGFYLAGLPLEVGERAARNASLPIAVALILLVPIFEMTWVTITRGLQRRPIAGGGRDHVSHHLVALGLPEQLAVAIIYAVAIAVGTVGAMTYRFGVGRVAPLIALTLLALVIFGVLLAMPGTPDDESRIDPRHERVNEQA